MFAIHVISCIDEIEWRAEHHICVYSTYKAGCYCQSVNIEKEGKPFSGYKQWAGCSSSTFRIVSHAMRNWTTWGRNKLSDYFLLLIKIDYWFCLLQLNWKLYTYRKIEKYCLSIIKKKCKFFNCVWKRNHDA